jgi:hypothetical protein
MISGPFRGTKHRFYGPESPIIVLESAPFPGSLVSETGSLVTASSSGESRANLSSSECRRDGRPRHGLRDPYEEDARADRGDENQCDPRAPPQPAAGELWGAYGMGSAVSTAARPRFGKSLAVVGHFEL